MTALQFAAHKHRGQRRKDVGGSPYINHPIEVATILATQGGVADSVTLMAAILHDTIEDTDTTSEELGAVFGTEGRDVAATPPADWSLDRRRDYLDWTARVAAGCRGTNAELERYYDEVLASTQAALEA